MKALSTNQAAPLREIVQTMTGPPHVIEEPGFHLELKTVVHKLICGHTTDPYIRDGCRLEKLPKRRRCKQCLGVTNETRT